MIKLISFTLIILSVSCSTTKNRNKIDVDPTEITKEDFKQEKAVNYSKADDSFKSNDKNSALALEALKRTNSSNDIEVKSVLDRITLACYEKDFEEGFSLIKENTISYRRNPIFWNQVGTCFMLKGERRKALLFYNKALEFKASYAPAYNNLGFMYRTEDEDQKALVAFTRAKKSNRYARTPLYNLGNLYLEYGLYDQAIRTFTGLYNMAKNDVEIINGLAVAYLMKGNVNQSISFYRKIDSDYLEQPVFGLNYSLALYRNNNKVAAKEAFLDIEKDNLGEWKRYYKNIAQSIGVQK